MRSFGNFFWRISFNCIWIKSCSWRYCVFRDMVLCQHLSWCSGLHRLSYISCWQNRRQCLCVYYKLLQINPYMHGQIFSVSCILWDKCGEGFALERLYRNYYWCLQTTRQITDSRVCQSANTNNLCNNLFVIYNQCCPIKEKEVYFTRFPKPWISDAYYGFPES